MAGPDVVDDLLVVDPVTGARTVDLQYYVWEEEPFIPVEFSAAAFRFAHSQVRSRYQLNTGGELIHILVPSPPTRSSTSAAFDRSPRDGGSTGTASSPWKAPPLSSAAGSTPR